MLIKNFNEIATNQGKKDALKIIDVGLHAALPTKALRKILRKNKLSVGKKSFLFSKYTGVYLVGIGKAADFSARIVCLLTQVDGGIIVNPSGVKSELNDKNFKILYGGHPLPNRQSVKSGKQIINFLKKRKPTDFVIFLISGGGSSLVSLPDGISLQDKIIVTNLLLKSGATIREINCIRKHLSKIKGGQLTKYLPCEAVSLVMSDVVGNNLSDIASALTYYDDTTFKDAKKILNKYRLKKYVPQSILRRLDLGINNKIPETPKFSKVQNYIIATNDDCLNAMTMKAQKLGYDVKLIRQISGQVKEVSEMLLGAIKTKQNSCLIFGGEPTVKIVGTGKGGRNQELVLYVLRGIKENWENTVIAACGTDGKDGNTDASGAIVENSNTFYLEIPKFLKNNNSYYLLKKYKGLIFTGPTYTNLMDIGILLHRK